MSIVMNLVLAATQMAMAGGLLPIDRTYIGQGTLITVRMTVADGKAKLFLAGKEAVRLDPKDPIQLLTLTAFIDDGKKEELRFVQDGEFYVTVLPAKTPRTLSVSAKKGNVKEDIKLQIERAP